MERPRKPADLPLSGDASISYPFVVPTDPLKRCMRNGMGRLVRLFRPGLEHEFLEGRQPGGRLERWALQALLQQLERNGDKAAICRIQEHYWASDDVVEYHMYMETGRDRMFAQARQPFMDGIQALARSVSAETVCEIGCGSGHLLREMASALDGIRQFVGLDLSAAQTAANQANNTEPNMYFVAGDALEWIRLSGVHKCCYLD